MSKKDKQGIAILLFVVTVVVFLFGLRHVIAAKADNIDPDTLCRIGKNDPVLKVLIDKTDPWNIHGQQRLAQLIKNLKSSLAQYERLSLYILDETGTYSPSPLFDMCNPGRGDQANELYENPHRIQQKFEEQFSAPLDLVLESLLLPGTAPQSPILETIKGLRENDKERLVVVSDMMQNSTLASFYGKSPVSVSKAGDASICSMENPYQLIQVYYVNRPNVQIARKQEVRNFWNICMDDMAWQKGWKNL